jgi:hypothetical protein
MNLKDLMDEWDKDTVIDRTDLTTASLNTPKLHAKYFRIYMGERAKLIRWTNELAVLKKDKFEFLTDGPHSETPDSWELPPKGKIIRADADRYVDTDKQIIELAERVDLQKEKMKFLDSIIYAINTRNYVIKNAIDVIKFESGA